MRSARKLVAAFAVSCTALAGALVGAAPAQAAEGYDRCPAENFCLFTGPDGTGAIGIFQSGSPDLRQQGLDDNVRSFWNRSARTFEAYDGYDYAGSLLLRQSAYGAPNNAQPGAVGCSSARLI